MTYSIYRYGLLAAVLFLFSASCQSTSEPQDPGVIPRPALFVLNEGAFGGTNASLDAIDLAKGERIANAIPNLGDVGSDIELIDGDIVIVSSGSKRLVRFSPLEGEIVAEYVFDQTDAPNAVAAFGNRALVTHLYVPGVDIYDLTSNRVTGEIVLSQGSVDAVVHNGRAYVTGAADSLYIIDLATLGVIDAIWVGPIPQRVLIDVPNNQAIVQVWGSWAPPGPGFIVAIDLTTHAERWRREIETSCFVNRVVLGNDRLFVLFADRTEHWNPSTGETADAAFIDAPFLGGGYDRQSNELYLGSGDYVSAGEVKVYDATTGAFKRSYPAGIAPAHFAFYR